MPSITLLDGRRIAGGNWAEVEANWADWFMNQLVDSENFRQEVADRAKLWSGVEMSIDGSSEDFLFECERAGMIHSMAVLNIDIVDIAAFIATVPAARQAFLNRIAERAASAKKGKTSYAVNG